MRPAALAPRTCLRALTTPLHVRRFNSLTSRFREGDIVLLKRTDKTDAAPILTRPLKHKAQIQSHRGSFAHDDIIGRTPRDLVTSSNGRTSRLFHPTLADYVTLTSRLVTPVYPGEANLIVSLLDIHAPPPSLRGANYNPRPLEILEAGTGHGSLTLHLARAVHAANAHVGPEEEDGQARRGAVVHSLDISSEHTRHASSVVRSFRHGLYTRDVDFHTGNIPDFVAAQYEKRGNNRPFLSYVVLDLPAVDEQLEAASAALVPNGVLAAFCPSVTQLVNCIQLAKKKGLPLFLEHVVELGANKSGGRPWDVRLSKKSAHRRLKSENQDTFGLEPPNDDSAHDVDSWDVVCRPKFGGVITAGGFLGLWNKTVHD